MRFKDPTPKEHFSSFGISSAPSGVHASVMALITLSNLGSSINEVSSCKGRKNAPGFFGLFFQYPQLPWMLSCSMFLPALVLTESLQTLLLAKEMARPVLFLFLVAIPIGQ